MGQEGLQDAPKVVFYDDVVEAEGTYRLDVVAKLRLFTVQRTPVRTVFIIIAAVKQKKTVRCQGPKDSSKSQ